MTHSDASTPNRFGRGARLRRLVAAVVLSLLVAGGGWLVVKVRQAARLQETVRALVATGWEVGYEHEVLGCRFGDVVYVGPAYGGPAYSGAGYDLGDEHMEQLNALTGLRRICLDNTRVMGPGLEHLKSLAGLRELSLDGARVADVGLEHIRGLANLKVLIFSHMPVTDTGLEHLKAMTNLELLVVCCLHRGDKRISDEGVEELKRALPNCTVVGP